MTEQTVAPSTSPERAEAAEDLLREFLEISGVTHKYPVAGGHDSIGANFTCAGCELAERVRLFLDGAW